MNGPTLAANLETNAGTTDSGVTASILENPVGYEPPT